MKKHLILAPHHDDTEFGLGGCVQKWLEAGDKITVMIFYQGGYTRSDGKPIRHSVRMEETIASFKLLGIASWYLCHQVFVENHGNERFSEMVSAIEHIVRTEKPTDTYVCLPSFNQDHVALFEATKTAFRPLNLRSNLHAYEYAGNIVPDADPVPAFGQTYHPLTEAQAEKKMAALRLHVSQWEGGRKPWVCPERAELMMLLRGALCDTKYAECTYLMHATERYDD